MNGAENTDRFTKWAEVVAYRARLLQSGLASLSKWVTQVGGDDSLFDQLSAPYQDLLRELYAEEFPIAEAFDSSDIIIQYKGPSVDAPHIRLSLLNHVFGNVKTEVGKITRAIAGLKSRQQIPPEMELGLTALSRGSLYIGLVAATPEGDGQAPLFGEDDPILKATQQALRILGIVVKDIGEGKGIEAISESVSDPVIRDVTLGAIKNLAPSGRTGIDYVNLLGRGLELNTPVMLTSDTRDIVRKFLYTPPRENYELQFIGKIREIDLDLQRFILRQIAEKPEIRELPCSYGELYADSAIEGWLNRPVKVAGKSDLDSKTNLPRILYVSEIELLD